MAVSEGFEPRQQQSNDWKAGKTKGVVDDGQVGSAMMSKAL